MKRRLKIHRIIKRPRHTFQTMLKIITTGRLGKEFAASLAGGEENIIVRYAEEPVARDLGWANCLAAFSAPEGVPLSGIEWIHSFGAGVEGFLERKDIDPDTIITRTVGRLGYRMGEFCLCHILNFFQHTFSVYENKRIRAWEQIEPVGIADKTVLILGTGEMAKGISLTLAPLQMKIIGVNTTGKNPQTVYSRCITFDEIGDVSERVSCIINTLPFSRQTRGILNKEFFQLFNDALFINVGRGASVVDEDLMEALANKKIAFAVLDVFETEPLSEASPLWKHPSVFISPHQSAQTDLDDILESFREAHRCIQMNERNRLFVDVKRGY
jgi:phosphoglycerate dehydrogenase-like enzyme